VNRKSLLSAIILLGGAVLIAIGWWDYWSPNQINRWWAGERVYPFYWQRLALTLAVILPLALLAWWLASQPGDRLAVRGVAYRRRRAAWGFAIAFAIPFILLLKYGVTWLGINYGSSVWAYSLILVLSAIIAWLVWPALRNQRLLEWLDRQGPMIILTAIVIYVVVYGGLSIGRHVSFRTHALDLGTTDQAMWNTSRGRLLEYTPLPVTFGNTTPGLSPESRLVDGKMELIFLPLSLLYWLWADPRLLIALQTILLASGAIPLYHLARAELDDSVASLAITLAYLLYLPLHYVILSDFHASALMVPFLLWAWHAAKQKRWRNYYLGIGVALLCQIDAALVLVGTGTYLSLTRTEGWGSGKRRLHGVATLLLGLLWIALDFGLVSPWAKASYGPGTNELLRERYGQFGQGSLEIAWGLLTHPLDALRALAGREKLQTLVDLMATLGWTPLLAPLTLLPALPVLVLNLLAASPYQNSILAHYFAPVIPFLFIAVIWGCVNAGRWIARLSASWEKPALPPARPGSATRAGVEGRRLATLFVLITTLLVTWLFSPLPPGWKFRLAHYYQVSEHERALARILDLIPADAIVSAQSDLFPHLSRRPVIYLYPTVADAEYVVLNLDYSANKTPIDEYVFYAAVEGLLANPTFHVAAFDNGALLLQRSPGQAPPAFAENLASYNTGLYRSALVEYRGPTRLQADNMYQSVVVLENRGTQSWETVGSYPIYLSYHWWTADGNLVEWDGLRNSLTQNVKPGDTFPQQVRFVTPAEPGDYVLEWDLVHENRTWFSEQGGITLRLDVTVY
jgi:uncharacterized membrane protein